MRVYITTRTVGQNFGTIGQLRRHHPDCVDHGEIIAVTDTKPLGFIVVAKNTAIGLAAELGHTVVDEDYQP